MCSGWTRRLFLGSVVALAAPHVLLRAKDLSPFGCAWNGASAEGNGIYSSSNNDVLDRGVITEIKRISQFLPINPGIMYIYDASPNAFAVPESMVPDTQGTVLLGLNLIDNEIFKLNRSGVAVAGICAHECAHIFQFQSGSMQSLAGPTAALIELHADYIAGMYLGRREGTHSKKDITDFALTLFCHGDFQFNEPGHHGTPLQRVMAMKEGYDVGHSGTEIMEGIRQGEDFVKRVAVQAETAPDPTVLPGHGLPPAPTDSAICRGYGDWR